MKLLLPRLRRPLRRRAFTLLELLIVVVVIGILAGLALIRFGQVQEKAYVATMQSDLRNFATARAIHISENEGLPGSTAGVSGFNLSALVFEAGYTESSATEWSLLLGHNKTETRCVLSTVETGGAHRISCSADATLAFDATSAGNSVTVDATTAIQGLAFAPEQNGFGAAWAATDADIALVSWDFGDGTRESGEPATHKTRTHTYAEPGAYTIQLTLVKKTGEVKSGTKQVEASNQVPVASFGFSPASPLTAETVTFTSTSTDPDGDALTLSWSIGGQAATGASVQRSFDAAGTYVVTLTATDSKGASHQVSQNVVIGNRAPTASFTHSAAVYEATKPISFTSTSTDADGTVVGWSWNFGDGNGSTAENPSHTYAAAGTYTVTLTVTDNSGQASQAASQSVTVSGATTTYYDESPANFSTWGGNQVFAMSDGAVQFQGQDARVTKGVLATSHSLSGQQAATVITVPESAQDFSVQLTEAGGRAFVFHIRVAAQDAGMVGKTINLCLAGNSTEGFAMLIGPSNFTDYCPAGTALGTGYTTDGLGGNVKVTRARLYSIMP